MAVKKEIDTTDFETLDDSLKSLYVKTDGDKYRLDLDDDWSSKQTNDGELKRALDRERQEAKEAKAELAKMRKELVDGKTLTAKKAGDIETLEKQWNEKLTKQERESLEKLTRKDEFIKKTLVDNVAIQIANKIAPKNVEIILPHIKARLAADLDGDSPVTRVLDQSGQTSVLSVKDLQDEFVANPVFAPIIEASKASGSSTPDSQAGKLDGVKFDKKVDLSKLSPKDLAATIKARAAGRNNQM